MSKEPEDQDEDDDDVEPFTLGEYEASLVMALEGVARIARHLGNSLTRQERPSRFAHSITELRTIEVLCSTQAARLADHYETTLLWDPEDETAPVAVPDKRRGVSPNRRLTRMLANTFAEVVPSTVEVRIIEGGELCFSSDLRATVLAISDWLADDAGPRDQAVVRISSDALQRLQSFIVEVSDQQWPVGASTPTAHARVDDGRLYLWLEQDGATVLECTAIEL